MTLLKNKKQIVKKETINGFKHQKGVFSIQKKQAQGQSRDYPLTIKPKTDNVLAEVKPTLEKHFNALAELKPALEKHFNALAELKPALEKHFNALAELKPAQLSEEFSVAALRIHK